ncbi:MAG TPA: sensor domain-containing diguanylate cyclase [Acidimicrobiales bacterium]|nr:sensor domain-containing diguanylate cyclase [Acidimicrobiales bacterium]
MEAAPFAKDETGRLFAVRELGILETEPEERFDRIVQLAARLTSSPIAIMSIVDERRVFIKSAHGAGELGISLGYPFRDYWFCSYVVARGETVVVDNARADARFNRTAIVANDPGLVSYAGAPVRGPGGEVVGALGIFDTKPRTVSEPELKALTDLSKLLEAELASLPHAMTDALTNALNFRTFEKIGNRLIEFGDRIGQPCVLLRADVVGMEEINRQRGFDTGDRVLATAATLLSEGVRRSDLVGRLSSDEFVALLFGADADAASSVINRIVLQTRRFNAKSDLGYEIKFHLGGAVRSPGESGDISGLLLTAEPRREAEPSEAPSA